MTPVRVCWRLSGPGLITVWREELDRAEKQDGGDGEEGTDVSLDDWIE